MNQMKNMVVNPSQKCKICGSLSHVHPSIEISYLSIKVRWREKISSKFAPWSVRFEGHKRHCCAIVTKGRYWFWNFLEINFFFICPSLAMGEFVDIWRQWCEISRRLNVFEGPPSPSIDVFGLYLQCICIWRSLLSEFIHAAHPAIVLCCCCWSMPHWCPFLLNHFLLKNHHQL